MGFFFVALIGKSSEDIKNKGGKLMEQQEEKSLKNYYANCILRNKFGLSNDLAELISKFMLNFYDKFFADFDAEKVKHYRNAASNIGMMPSPSFSSKIEFYIGLMDKDTKSYHFSKEQARKKVFEILGDCTIVDATGSYTNEHGEQIIMDTFVVTKIMKNIPTDYLHNVSYKLKEIFNQASIINVRNQCIVKYNDEDAETIKYIEDMMQEYNFSWDKAEDATNAGW